MLARRDRLDHEPNRPPRVTPDRNRNDLSGERINQCFDTFAGRRLTSPDPVGMGDLRYPRSTEHDGRTQGPGMVTIVPAAHHAQLKPPGCLNGIHALSW
jgi:hypothetical protein